MRAHNKVLVLLSIAILFSRDCSARALTDDDLILHVKNALIHQRLAPRPRCVEYKLARDSNPGVDRVDVSAKHDKACGGDPLLDEHLFSVYVDQKTGQMATDAADSVGGTLKLLSP